MNFVSSLLLLLVCTHESEIVDIVDEKGKEEQGILRPFLFYRVSENGRLRQRWQIYLVKYNNTTNILIF